MNVLMQRQKLAADGIAYLLGQRIGALLFPVLVAILLVSWSVLNLSSLYIVQDHSSFFVVMDEESHENVEGKVWSSLVNALVAVCTITAVTFLMVLLYRCHCEKILFAWLAFSAASVLFAMMWIWLDLICTRFQIPYDFITIGFILWNIGIVGLISIFYYSHPILTQVYLVLISIIITWLLSFLPEWTTWTLLICVAAYDVVAVVSTRGPLHMLLKAAEKRNEPLPAFVYDTSNNIIVNQRQNDLKEIEEGKIRKTSNNQNEQNINNLARHGLSHETFISYLYNMLTQIPFKLGLGDFIFYSLLCGRAVEYSFLPFIISIISILLGLVLTITFLLFFRDKIRALPALPISIFCGTIIFFLSRYLVVKFDWFATISVLAL